MANPFLYSVVCPTLRSVYSNELVLQWKRARSLRESSMHPVENEIVSRCKQLLRCNRI